MSDFVNRLVAGVLYRAIVEAMNRGVIPDDLDATEARSLCGDVLWADS